MSNDGEFFKTLQNLYKAFQLLYRFSKNSKIQNSLLCFLRLNNFLYPENYENLKF